MKATPNDGVNVGDSTDGPELRYVFEFPSSGTYYVWVRTRGASGKDDSCHVGLNGTPATYGGNGLGDSSGSWVWANTVGGSRVTVDVPSAGTHTVNLWMREDGTEVDKIVLSPDSSYTPSGTGPDEQHKASDGGGDTAPLADGTYKLVAKHSGKAAVVQNGSTDDGANVKQYDYWAAEKFQWELTHEGNGYYQITNVNSGKALDVSGGEAATSNGDNIQQWSPHDDGNQDWKITEVESGYYKAVARHSGKCMDVEGVSPDNNATVLPL